MKRPPSAVRTADRERLNCVRLWVRLSNHRNLLLQNSHSACVGTRAQTKTNVNFFSLSKVPYVWSLMWWSALIIFLLLLYSVREGKTTGNNNMWEITGKKFNNFMLIAREQQRRMRKKDRQSFQLLLSFDAKKWEFSFIDSEILFDGFTENELGTLCARFWIRIYRYKFARTFNWVIALLILFRQNRLSLFLCLFVLNSVGKYLISRYSCHSQCK